MKCQKCSKDWNAGEMIRFGEIGLQEFADGLGCPACRTTAVIEQRLEHTFRMADGELIVEACQDSKGDVYLAVSWFDPACCEDLEYDPMPLVTNLILGTVKDGKMTRA